MVLGQGRYEIVRYRLIEKDAHPRWVLMGDPTHFSVKGGTNPHTRAGDGGVAWTSRWRSGSGRA